MRRNVLTAAFVVSALAAQGCPAAENAGRAESLHALLDSQTQSAIVHDPELRSLLGISGDGIDLSAQLTDVSLPKREERRAELKADLDAIESWDRSKLVGQERWNYDLATWFYTTQIDLMRFDWAPAWLPVGATTYAVDQLFSVPVTLPQFLDNNHAVTDEASARNYIARLGAAATKLDQVRENFDMQAAHGVVPPQIALEGAATQIRALLQPLPDDSVFVQSLRRKLEKVAAIAPARRESLLAQAATAVGDRTNPAYARLLARLDEVIATRPGNRGVWALPDGKAFYDAALRWNTSTSLDADTIHRVGLAEVARIDKEMDALLDRQGMREGTVGERMLALNQDERFLYADSDAGRAELMADIGSALGKLQPFIPRYFGRVPSQPLEVRSVPGQAQATAPGGYYSPPAMDGSRPGVFFINLGDMAANTRWSLPTLTYHEGSPGHHFQISLGQTLTGLPLLRRSLNPSAFTEGWALYAEQLAAEMGLYEDDPWGDLGRLRAEMFRSVRLVVDTGLHRKRWTPERAIAYMLAKTGMTESEVRIEVYRYLVQPGQASSYKLGHLKMVELRERVQRKLGKRFDIRAFHDLVLGNGALPLAVLEKAVDEWINSESAGS